MKKYENTRIVSFEQDYAPAGKVLYKKGSTHAIHVSIVETLKKLGVKMKVETLDIKKAEQKAKARMAA